MKSRTIFMLYAMLLLAARAMADSVEINESPKSLKGLLDQGLDSSSDKLAYDLFKKAGKAELCPDSLFAAILDDLPNKYPWESHHITTEDGYVLRTFRIQAKNTSIVPGKPTVYLQHGTLSSADDWIVNLETNSIGIRLANEGYDVWLGNSRGNKYCLKSLETMSASKFWDFSFQDMARYDLPANVKYILEQTGQKDLIYVGHSQGTTSMFASLSDDETKDYMNEKVKLYVALAPVTYLANCNSPFYNMMALYAPSIELTSKTWGVYDMSPGLCSETSAEAQFRAALCVMYPIFCQVDLGLLDIDPTYDNRARLPYFKKHAPSGSSLKQFYHYTQWIRQLPTNPKFLKYDYGYYGNKKHYGQSTPPEYDLNNITTRIRGYSGRKDGLADYTDTELLKAKMKKFGKDAKWTWIEQSGHMTFLWGKDINTTIESIIADMKEVQ